MSDHTPVLIIGAGPTGLTLACLLKQHGIDFRIIEKRDKLTQTSNALALQTRTLELLDDMDIIDRFLKQGERITTLRINEGKTALAEFKTDTLNSKYPFILMLPQNISEELLNGRLDELNVPVERSTALLNLKDTENQITAVIQNTNGDQETITCNYLIACDGAHSQVRQQLNIPFPGKDLVQHFILADMHIDTALPSNQVNAFFSPEGILALFPMAKNYVRFVANLNSNKQTADQALDPANLQNILDKRTAKQIKIKDITWTSAFYLHSKKVNEMSYNHVFLAGDAAHIHSPAGGQGMNTGMQDAYNLAWKLASVIKEKAKPILLNSYSQERLPVASDVLKMTEMMTKISLLHNPLLRGLRRIAIQSITHIPSFQKSFIQRITQRSLHYKKSLIIDYQHQANNHALAPGDFISDVLFSDENNKPKYLTELVHGIGHHILFFSGLEPNPTSAQTSQELITWIQNTYPDLINIHVISSEPNLKSWSGLDEHCISDVKLSLHHHFRIKNPAIYVIRPDKYIGYCSNSITIKPLNNYLNRYFIDTRS